ncbi:helix-turn-helix domain-containing protein [Variovorax sp. SG517]|uniref:helix-turn-helix domain-containing protein n=1 Tax=Variovorax sp. SG517 TaxID=2587117 RepID=UPI00352447E1
MIKRLRHRGLSGSEIARRAGVSQSRISRWENGAVPAAADDVWKLQELERSLEASSSDERAEATT